MTLTRITSDGITDAAIVNADINASAAIAGTKISPDFGSQAISTTGTAATGALTVTGAITASTSITATNNLTTNGNFTVSGTNPNIFLTDTNNDSDFRISNSNGVLEVRDTTNSVTRFQINSSGTVDVAGNLTVGGTVDGVDIAALNTTVGTKLANIVEDTSPQLGGTLDSNGQNIHLGDNSRVRFGASQDLDIYHNTHSYIENDTGNLYISNHESNSDSIYATVKEGGIFGVFKHGTSEFLIKGTAGGSAELWHDGSKKFETLSNGAEVSGHLHLGDNNQLRLGNVGSGGDLRIYHDGSDSLIQDAGTGLLGILTNGLRVNNAANNESMIKADENGAVELYYNNNKSLETTQDGGVKAQGNYIVGTGGRGLQFNAGDSGSSELLDDYEEGIFIVTLANSLAATGTQKKLTYTKIGNKVHISGQFQVTTGGSDLVVNNLPFTTKSTGGTDETFSTSIVKTTNVTFPTDGSASGEIQAMVLKNDTNMTFVYTRSGSDPNGHTATTNGYYTVSLWYTT